MILLFLPVTTFLCIHLYKKKKKKKKKIFESVKFPEINKAILGLWYTHVKFVCLAFAIGINISESLHICYRLILSLQSYD